jgi:hypothetical protein
MQKDDGAAARVQPELRYDSVPPISSVRRRRTIEGLHYPWPSDCNPHVDEIETATRQWVLDMGLVTQDQVGKRYDPVGIGLLTALTYPRASLDRAVLIAQFMAWIFIQDDVYDDGRVTADDLARLRTRFETYMNVLRDRRAAPDAEPTTAALGDIVRRLASITSSEWMDRFAQTMRRFWMDGVLVETMFRSRGLVPDPTLYMAMRIESVGGYPVLDLVEVAHGFELPATLVDDPILRKLAWLTCRVLAYANDVFSYEKERRAGDVGNYIHVLRNDEPMPIAEAVHQTLTAHDRELDHFCKLVDMLPEVEPALARMLEDYVTGCQNWMHGAYRWQSRSRRYASGRAYLKGERLQSIPPAR